MKSNTNTMANILACRICLTTTGNLHNLVENNLVLVYENLIAGSNTVANDELPQYVCNFCRLLLHKYDSFRWRCLRAQELLRNELLECKQLSTERIRHLALTNNTQLPYLTVQTEHTNIQESYIKPESLSTTTGSLKQSTEECIVKSEFVPSDDEPLFKLKCNDNLSVKSEDDDNDLDFNLSGNDNEEVSDGVNDTVQNNDEAATDNEDDSNIQVVCLTIEQQLEEIEARKQSYNYLNSFYKCQFCYKGFLTEATFKNHMVKHDPSSGTHICEICKIRCPDLKSLKSHSVISHCRKYTCSLCGHSCKSAHRAKEHLQWHRGKKYSCHVCGATFAKSTSQLTHLRLRHPSKFTCDLCGDSFIGEYGLKIHKKKAHRDNEKATSNTYSCSDCGAEFRSSEALAKHSDAQQNGQCDMDASSCVYCGENLCSRELLAEHLKAVHQNEQPVKCSDCDRTFVHARSHALHYHRVHLGVRLQPSKCTRRERAAVCEICGKKCLSNASLVYHQRTHTGEKPYQCAECPKRFSMVQRLQIHARIHTGERPFKCSQCPKAFKHKAALNRHDRVHTGEKPYQCAHCGKAFSQSNSMKLHVRTVHLKLPTPYPTRGRKKNDIM